MSRATATEARAAFPRPAWDAPVATPAAAEQGPTSDPCPAPTLASVHQIAADIAAKLVRAGAPGSFTVTEHRVTLQLEWTGARHHRGEAETALVAALTAAGYTAGALPGFGVRVNKPATPPPAPLAPVQPIRCKGWCGRELPFAPPGGMCAVCAPIAPPAPVSQVRVRLVCSHGYTPSICPHCDDLPKQGCAPEPRWATRPAAVFAAQRTLTAPTMGPVAPSDLDPEERSRSMLGRVLAPFGEV